MLDLRDELLRLDGNRTARAVLVRRDGQWFSVGVGQSVGVFDILIAEMVSATKGPKIYWGKDWPPRKVRVTVEEI